MIDFIIISICLLVFFGIFIYFVDREFKKWSKLTPEEQKKRGGVRHYSSYYVIRESFIPGAIGIPPTTHKQKISEETYQKIIKL